MAAVRWDRWGGGLGHVEAAGGDNFDVGAGEMVPTAEVGEGDAETVGDGDQRVAAPGGVEDHARGGGGWGRLGDDQCIEALERTTGVKLVVGGQF